MLDLRHSGDPHETTNEQLTQASFMFRTPSDLLGNIGESLEYGRSDSFLEDSGHGAGSPEHEPFGDHESACEVILQRNANTSEQGRNHATLISEAANEDAEPSL